MYRRNSHLSKEANLALEYAKLFGKSLTGVTKMGLEGFAPRKSLISRLWDLSFLQTAFEAPKKFVHDVKKGVKEGVGLVGQSISGKTIF